MKKNIKQLTSDVEKKLDELYPDEELIYDGILDFQKYDLAKYKIMWVLKEPYDHFDEDGKPSGGGWHFRDALLPKTQITDFDKGSRNTFEPIIYSAFSILNEFPCSTTMDLISDNPNMIEALKSISYINIKKTPGQTFTPDSALRKSFEKNKEVLVQQIELSNPDIIIFGNTLKYFGKYTESIFGNFANFDNFKYSLFNKRIHIDAFHPAQRSYSKWDYINELVTICKENEKYFQQ